MNETLLAKVNNDIQTMAQKIGIPTEKLEQEYQSIYDRVQGSTDVIKVKRAMTNLKGNHRELRTKSTALKYKVVLLSQTGVVDFGAKRWAKLEQEYKVRPGEMQAEGRVTEENGKLTFIDKQQTHRSGAKNFNYGNPIPEHGYRNTVRALVKKAAEDTKWHPGMINLYDDQTQLPIQLGYEYEVSLNGTFNKDISGYVLNGSTVTKFEDGQKIQGSLTDLIESSFGENLIDLSDLKSFFEANQGNFSAYFLADVRTTFVGITKTGKSYARVADHSLESDQSVMCFCSTKLELETDKGYLLFGTVSRGKGYDSDKKEATDEIVYNINAQGFVALEE